MPTYTYTCGKCGHSQDVFHAMSASPRVQCEECGGKCARQLGTGAGIIFKGSGFYETDFKSKSGKPAESGAGNGKEAAAAKSDSSTASSGDSAKAPKDAGTSLTKQSKPAAASKE